MSNICGSGEFPSSLVSVSVEEKEQKEKQLKKHERKKQNAETLEIMAKLELDTKRPKEVTGLGATVSKQLKRKGVRLRKNTVVRGIKIKDAESKRKVKEILAAEESMKEHLME